MRILPFLLLLSIPYSCTSTHPPESPGSVYHDLTNYQPADTLIRVFAGEEGALGTTCGYLSTKGDTIIPTGRFQYCFQDTATVFVWVVEEDNNAYAIDQQGQRLWDMYWYDNGPDYVEEGLFRILRNGKIGFADTTGRVVIPTQYACASAFSEGKAEVTLDCELEADAHGEHQRAISDTWFTIDRSGQKITE